MVDLKLQIPATDKIDVDAEPLAAIDRGIKDADEGRSISIAEAHKIIPKWIQNSNHRSCASEFKISALVGGLSKVTIIAGVLNVINDVPKLLTYFFQQVRNLSRPQISSSQLR
jgi:hypothetical protein